MVRFKKPSRSDGSSKGFSLWISSFVFVLFSESDFIRADLLKFWAFDFRFGCLGFRFTQDFFPFLTEHLWLKSVARDGRLTRDVDLRFVNFFNGIHD